VVIISATYCICRRVQLSASCVRYESTSSHNAVVLHAIRRRRSIAYSLLRRLVRSTGEYAQLSVLWETGDAMAELMGVPNLSSVCK